MADPISFFVPGQVIPQGSHIAQATKAGKAYLRESNGEKLRPWRAAMKKAAKEAMTGHAVFAGPVAVTLTFTFNRPANQDGTRTWPSMKTPGVCDVDKATRAALDAMSKTVYYDDVQVVSLTALKLWANYDVDRDPGVLIWCGHVPGFRQPDVVALP